MPPKRDINLKADKFKNKGIKNFLSNKYEKKIKKDKKEKKEKKKSAEKKNDKKRRVKRKKNCVKVEL
jgi:hypothetical protein